MPQSSRPSPAIFAKRFPLLVTFVQENGRFPISSGVEESLYRFHGELVRSARKGELDDGWKAQLDEFTPGWNEPRLRTARQPWDVSYTELTEFVSENGRFPSDSRNAPEDERKLFSWLSGQKAKHRDGTLAVDRAELFAKLTPRWPVSSELRFEDRLSELVAYVAEHDGWPSAQTSLGRWLVHQRTSDRRGVLDEARRSMLDELMPDWALPSPQERYDAIWRDNVDAIARYQEKHGRLPVQSGTSDDPQAVQLGTWLRNTRSALAGKASTLSLTEERIQYLRQHVPEVIDPKTPELWQAHVDEAAQLVASGEKVNTSRRDLKFSDGGSVGVWLSNQRLNVRKGRVSPERRRILKGTLPTLFGDLAAL